MAERSLIFSENAFSLLHSLLENESRLEGIKEKHLAVPLDGLLTPVYTRAFTQNEGEPKVARKNVITPKKPRDSPIFDTCGFYIEFSPLIKQKMPR